MRARCGSGGSCITTVDEAVEAQDLSETERLGIDDTSFRRGQDYVSVFCDLDPGERRAVFVTEGRDQQTVEQFVGFLKAHGGDPENITEVCQDMSKAYLAGVLKQLQSAAITFDRYHIKQQLNKAIDEVRREESKQSSSRGESHPPALTEPVMWNIPHNRLYVPRTIMLKTRSRLVVLPCSARFPPLMRST